MVNGRGASVDGGWQLEVERGAAAAVERRQTDRFGKPPGLGPVVGGLAWAAFFPSLGGLTCLCLGWAGWSYVGWNENGGRQPRALLGVRHRGGLGVKAAMAWARARGGWATRGPGALLRYRGPQ